MNISNGCRVLSKYFHFRFQASVKKSGEAHLLFGEYDILVILNVKDMNEIDEKVSEIRNTEGVETTCTCVDRCCL